MEVKIFFNTHKKQGKETGQSALDTIVKKAFIGSQYFDDVNFNPPEGFFDDKYKLSALKKILFVSLVTFILCLISDKFVIDQFYIKTFDFFFKLEDIVSVFFLSLTITLFVYYLSSCHN